MIERKIIISAIVSTEFLQQVKPVWDISLFESATAKMIATWIWEYFEKYAKAPNRDIENIFYSKLQDNKLPKEIAEEIEDEILPGLSAEYENSEFNLEYILAEAQKYFKKRKLLILSQNLETLTNSGEEDKAEKLIGNFTSTDLVNSKLENFILTADQIRKKNRARPTMLMKPWLRESQLTILYGSYGSGKSLLAITVAFILGLENYDDEECEIGEWIGVTQTGCLYIDGELGELEMEERISSFEWLGKQLPKYKMRILSIPEYQLETEDTFYLSTRINQQKIIQWLKNRPTYKLVILDSASTLFGLEDENSNSEWNNKINPFIRDLRAINVACILLHHAGKTDKKGLRGASSMGAMAHNIFRLKDHEKKNIDRGEAWFVLAKDKQRSAGVNFKTFSLHYTISEDKQTNWMTTDNY